MGHSEWGVQGLVKVVKISFKTMLPALHMSAIHTRTWSQIYIPNLEHRDTDVRIFLNCVS